MTSGPPTRGLVCGLGLHVSSMRLDTPFFGCFVRVPPTQPSVAASEDVSRWEPT